MTIKESMKSLDKLFSLWWYFLLKHLKQQSKLMTHFHKRHKYKCKVGVGKIIDFITDHNFSLNSMNS